MTDSEAAGLCEIAYTALLNLPCDTVTRLDLWRSMADLSDEIARLRNQSPEDVQKEFEVGR